MQPEQAYSPQFGASFGVQAQNQDFLKKLRAAIAQGGRAGSPGPVQAPAAQPGATPPTIEYPRLPNQASSINLSFGGSGGAATRPPTSSPSPTGGSSPTVGGSPPLQYPQMTWEPPDLGGSSSTVSAGSGGGVYPQSPGTTVDSTISYGGVVAGYNPDDEEYPDELYNSYTYW